MAGFQRPRGISVPMKTTYNIMIAGGMIIFKWSRQHTPKISVEYLLWTIFIQMCSLFSSFIYLIFLFNEINGFQSVVKSVSITMTLLINMLLSAFFIFHWKDHAFLLVQEYQLSSTINHKQLKYKNRTRMIWVAYFVITITAYVQSLKETTSLSTIGRVYKTVIDAILFIEWIFPVALFYQCCQTIANFISYISLPVDQIDCQTDEFKQIHIIIAMGKHLIAVSKNIVVFNAIFVY